MKSALLSRTQKQDRRHVDLQSPRYKQRSMPEAALPYQVISATSLYIYCTFKLSSDDSKEDYTSTPTVLYQPNYKNIHSQVTLLQLLHLILRKVMVFFVRNCVILCFKSIQLSDDLVYYCSNNLICIHIILIDYHGLPNFWDVIYGTSKRSTNCIPSDSS